MAIKRTWKRCRHFLSMNRKACPTRRRCCPKLCWGTLVIQTAFVFRLQVDGHTKIEASVLRKHASVDSLIENAVASRNFRIVS